MSLTDRLAAAQRPAPTPTTATHALRTAAAAPRPPATSRRRPPRRRRTPRRRQPSATRSRDVKRIVHAQLVEALGPKLYDAHMTQTELEQQVRVALQTALADDRRSRCPSADRTRISQEIADDILGYGPLEPLLRDSDLSEVMVNAFDRIYVERSGKLVKTDTAFADEAHLRRTIDKIVSKIGRRVDETSPMVDARLPDGSRVNAIIPPLALDGSKLTIRKFSEDPYTVEDLISFGTLTPRVGRPARGLRAGPPQHPGLGRYRCRQDDHAQRALVVHPRRRAHRHHRGRRRAPARTRTTCCDSSRARPTSRARARSPIRDLVKNSLRMRPDRIVVGEIRDAAALDMLQAMNTGHDGSISTLHANTPRDALARLETMVLMAGMDLPGARHPRAGRRAPST